MVLRESQLDAAEPNSPVYPDDAPSSVIASDVHRQLRDEAIANDLAASAPMPLALVWQGLARGDCRIVDAFFTSSRCYIVTARVASPATPVLSGRRLEILERILSGGQQKSVALDMDLAPSTVALHARIGLRNVGILSKPSRVHPMVMLAAKASMDRDLSLLGSVSVVFPHGVSLCAVGLPRPDHGLTGLLAPAELSVIRSLVEGHSYEEIAQRRGTSPRTVANQIAVVFRRMRVSGRNALVHRLFTDGPLSLPASPARQSWLRNKSPAEWSTLGMATG